MGKVLRFLVFQIIFFSFFSFFSSLTFAQETPAKSTASEENKPLYQKPLSSAKIINVLKLQILNEEDCKQLATLLANYVSNARPITKQQADINSKALSVALQLDPKCRAAVMANVRLFQNQEPALVDSKETPQTVSATLFESSKKLAESKEPNEVKLCSYLLELAALIDPHNENAIYESEVRKSTVSNVNWEVFYNEPNSGTSVASVAQDDSSKGSAPVNMQVVANGLAIGKLGASGSQIGILLPLIATVTKFSSAPNMPAYAVFSGSSQQNPESQYESQVPPVLPNGMPNPAYRVPKPSVGQQMNSSLQEAVRTIKIKYPNWEKGNAITFSFSDTSIDRLRDGPSATTAFALMLSSIFDGFTIDNTAAVTGDLSADFKVRRVGGVPDKIKGAIAGNCKLVVIPEENAQDFEDYIILNPISDLANIQIFTAKTLEEAISLMREDKSDDIKKSMDLFSQVQARLKLDENLVKKKSSYPTQIDEVLKLTPNHLSASLIKRYSEGNVSTQLSPIGSVEAIFNLSYPCTDSDLLASPTLVYTNNSTLDNIKSKLDGIKFKVDPTTRKLLDIVYKYVELSRGYNGSKSVVPILKAKQEVRAELAVLLSNNKVLNDLMKK